MRIVSGSEVIESSRASVRPDLTTLRNDSRGKIRRIKTDVGSMSHTPREIGYHFSGKIIHGIPSQQVVFHRRNRSMLKLEGACLAQVAIILHRSPINEHANRRRNRRSVQVIAKVRIVEINYGCEARVDFTGIQTRDRNTCIALEKTHRLRDQRASERRRTVHQRAQAKITGSV